MQSANATLPDLDGLSVAELKRLLREQHVQLAAKDQQLIAKDELLFVHEARICEQDTQLVAKDEQLVAKAAELRSNALLIESLKVQILKLRRQQFGRSSEQREHDIEQLELLTEQLEIVEAQHAPAPAKPPPSKRAAASPRPRRTFPAHLPRETTTIMPQEECCPGCGGNLKHLGEDVCETLELEPVRFKVMREVRPKLACTRCDTIVQASAPTRPIERGMAGPGLLAHVVVSKYADHQPLYRQAEIYAREGLDLDRSLLAQWVGNTTKLLMPLIDALRAHVLAAQVLHADDTTIPVLAPGRGQTKTGRLWTYVRDERPAAGQAAPAVWFTYSADRAGEHPQRHLADFTGILQADGYAGYSKLYEGGRVLEAACWAHARRKFVDLYELHQSAIAGEALDRIGALYAIEQEIRGRSPAERRAERQERSRPLLEAMHAWLQQTLATLSQKSATAKAIRYALTRWEALLRFCDDGRVEIDNNAAERALRCVALGRKNFLFAGSDTGGESAAALYSLLGSAKLNGHNLEAFLREVLVRIGDHPINRIAELLPWNLKPQHDPALVAADETPKLPPTA